MNIGIVGNEGAKFTNNMRLRARSIICNIIRTHPSCKIISGGCHLGGIDIWAEEIAYVHNVPTTIFKPKTLSWSGGYKPRNLLIARNSDKLNIIVVEDYHANYTGMRFDHCYHCKTDSHVKSGACWTGKQARKLGKKVIYHIIPVIE